ncbi:hypothetical protein [Thiomicrorhabdus sp. Kp2]|uniref:hypothetical protein n=1 Tax=Thiomicrorhabdus sp. Kp2 TaxID=1123518 RepID=UPI0003F647EB|nr:hypothetical protein [Thiomicrorhabdus sp. Kp2]
MQQKEVISIIEGLANGVNPITGEILPSTSPYNHPDVIRALFHAINLIPKVRKPKQTLAQKQQANIEKGLPQNYGLPWNQTDIDSVIQQFNENIAIHLIADQFCRKPRSIIGLLNKQGVITDEQASLMSQSYK